MSRILLVAVALSSLAVAAPSFAACAYSGTTLASGTPVAGAVDDGQIDRFRVSVPSGSVGEVILQAANGDIDMTVCSVATGAVVCYSHNQYPIADACVDEGTETTIQDVGPQLQAGQYQISVAACWSSKDGENCDYGDPIPSTLDLPDGTLDPLPPIQYGIGFQIV